MRSADQQPPISQTIQDLEKVFSSSPDPVAFSPSIKCPSDIKEVTAEGYCIAQPETSPEPFDQTLLKQIQQITQLGVKIEGQHLSRVDLAGILEGFAKVVRGDQAVQVTPAAVDGRSQENEDLRRLLVNAQETIIKLLSEQVTDRARLATMEAQLKFLPDLQAQADRAMAVASEAEVFRRELKSVRFELDTFRRTRLRTDIYRPRRIRSWWSWVTGRVLTSDAIGHE
jgi:hypothetical protein